MRKTNKRLTNTDAFTWELSPLVHIRKPWNFSQALLNTQINSDSETQILFFFFFSSYYSCLHTLMSIPIWQHFSFKWEPTAHVASTSNKMNTLHYLRESETITELIFSAFCIIFHNLSIKWLFALSAILISYFDLEAHSVEQQVKSRGCCMHQRSVPAAGACFPPTSLPHPHTILRFVSQQHLREHLGSFQVNWIRRQKSPRTPRAPSPPMGVHSTGHTWFSST